MVFVNILLDKGDMLRGGLHLTFYLMGAAARRLKLKSASFNHSSEAVK